MRKFLIASHGNFAEGIRSSLELITGPAENLFILTAYINGNKSIEEDLNAVLKQVSDEDELVIFTDLLGGSITNQVLQYALKPNVHVVSGVNLPLLIDVILADNETPVFEVLENAILNAREQIVYVNHLINSKKEDSLHD